MRISRLAAAAAGAALLMTTLVATSASALTTTDVRITPNEALVDGQNVVVAIHGAQPATETYTALCARNATGQSDCAPDISRGGTIGPDGTLSFDLGLEAAFTTGNGVAVDCRANLGDGCELLSYIATSETEIVTDHSGLHFDPDTPLLPPPTITVDPSTDLVDGTVVHVAGSGFVAGIGVAVLECVAPYTDESDCAPAHTFNAADRDGNLAAGIDVVAVLTTTAGDQVDCRLVPCEIVVTRPFFGPAERHTATAPISFRPDGPLRPPPVLTVVPGTGLVDGQAVTVNGTGFRSGTVVIGQCVAGTGSVFDRCPGFQFLAVDETGVLTAAVSVAVVESVPSGAVDCRTAPGCTIAAFDVNANVLAETPIAFAPVTPPPPPPPLPPPHHHHHHGHHHGHHHHHHGGHHHHPRYR